MEGFFVFGLFFQEFCGDDDDGLLNELIQMVMEGYKGFFIGKSGSCEALASCCWDRNPSDRYHH